MRLLFISLALICFLSCQREVDPTILNDNTDSIAIFSLNGTPNTCSRIVPSGIYKKNVPLDSSDRVTVDVTVTKIGSWTASTNTINGISFSGSANFDALGNQTITLQGTGVPTQVGANNFVLHAGDNHCSFILNVDTSSVAAPTVNASPVADAGPDKSVTLPTNTVTLSGTGTDIDGTIISYSWSTIAGPSSVIIVNPTRPQTTINNLTQGNYQFELTVTDNIGATGKDTISVTVLPAPSAGIFAMQQELNEINPLNDMMNYDASGKIIKITSNNYPERIISYSNNRISSIEYWYDNGSGTLYKGETHNFIYDGNGNVVKINLTDHLTNRTYLFAEYTYNNDNTLSRRKTYSSSSSSSTDNAFIYTNGNLTGFVQNPSAPIAGDTTFITYDSRINTFNKIYPQYYFLDLQTVYDLTFRSEIFYFSKNYPISFGSSLVAVTTNSTTQKPFEVRFNNKLWYRYVFN